MIKTEVKEVIVKKEKEIAIICDKCGKLIANEQEMDSDRRKGGYYYHVTTSHGDWGNDSHESLEWNDFCSTECMLDFFNKYIESKSDTLQFEFEREKL